jgi:3-hydroxy-3-methylglutaryl CoA synthase
MMAAARQGCMHHYISVIIFHEHTHRLEVGSESNPDRSRSIKAQLMKLMGAAGNNDLEVSEGHASPCAALVCRMENGWFNASPASQPAAVFAVFMISCW